MGPRSILKSLPYISPFPTTIDNSTSPEIPTPSFSNSPLPFASTSRIPPFDSPHVHFPPTPTLTRIEMTHSPFSYDRKPILVSPNACALPDRGERDVIYIEGSQERSSPSPECYGGYFPLHTRESQQRSDARYSKPSVCVQDSDRFDNDNLQPPSAPTRPSPVRRQTPYHAPSQTKQPETNFCPYSSAYQQPPPLVFDASSESESDMCVSPPADTDSLMVPGASHISTHFSSGALSMRLDQQPSPSYMDDKNNDSVSFDTPANTDMRFGKTSRTRKHGHDEGNPIDSERCSEGYSDTFNDSNSVGGDIVHRTRARTRHVGNGARSASSCTGLSSFREPGLDGCLGGF